MKYGIAKGYIIINVTIIIIIIIIIIITIIKNHYLESKIGSEFEGLGGTPHQNNSTLPGEACGLGTCFVASSKMLSSFKQPPNQ